MASCSRCSRCRLSKIGIVNDALKDMGARLNWKGNFRFSARILEESAPVKVMAPQFSRAIPATAERSESSKKQPSRAPRNWAADRFSRTDSSVNALELPPHPVLRLSVG